MFDTVYVVLISDGSTWWSTTLPQSDNQTDVHFIAQFL